MDEVISASPTAFTCYSIIIVLCPSGEVCSSSNEEVQPEARKLALEGLETVKLQVLEENHLINSPRVKCIDCAMLLWWPS